MVAMSNTGRRDAIGDRAAAGIATVTATVHQGNLQVIMLRLLKLTSVNVYSIIIQ
jgi:hypothetical protein